MNTITTAHGYNYIKCADGWRPACRRCGGTGTLPEWANVLNGTCFRCAGHGIDNPEAPALTEAAIDAQAAKRAKAREARAQKAILTAEKNVASAHARADQWKADNPAAATILDNILTEYPDTTDAPRDLTYLREIARSLPYVKSPITDTLAEEVETAWAAIEAARANVSAFQHLQAELGETVTVTGRVTRRTAFTNAYGSSTNAVTLETVDHGRVVMFTAAQWSWGVDEGDAVALSGVVKEHSVDDRDGGAQTVLTRPKLVTKEGWEG